jgi:hypothetical protein
MLKELSLSPSKSRARTTCPHSPEGYHGAKSRKRNAAKVAIREIAPGLGSFLVGQASLEGARPGNLQGKRRFSSMSAARIIPAAIAFFALVFGAGFALGTIRVVLLQPYFGASASRLLELPFMIVICYLAARFITRRIGPATRNQWLLIGLMAFVFLMAAEFVMGTFVFRTPLGTMLADLLTFTGALSFLAQSLIILFPALAAGWDRTRS